MVIDAQGLNGINAPNQPVPMGLPEAPAKISIGLKNGVGEKVRVHFSRSGFALMSDAIKGRVGGWYANTETRGAANGSA